jgi:heme exporter protein D
MPTFLMLILALAALSFVALVLMLVHGVWLLVQTARDDAAYAARIARIDATKGD